MTTRRSKQPSPTSEQPASATNSSATGPAKHPLQSFRVETLHRETLKPWEGNPRTIDRHARKKLRESVKKGLVEPLVWNRRTGNLVSGHQRLSILDEDFGGTDYTLDVSAIDVSEADERTLNVRLNNTALTGSYDFGALQAMLADASVPIDPKDFAFDALDLAELMPDVGAGKLFDSANDAAAPEIDRIEAMQPPADLATREAEIAKIKAAKLGSKTRGREADSAEFYAVFVGRTSADVVRLLDLLSLDKTQRYHDIDVLFSHLEG